MKKGTHIEREPPRFPETQLFESGCLGLTLLLLTVCFFFLRGRYVVYSFQKATIYNQSTPCRVANSTSWMLFQGSCLRITSVLYSIVDALLQRLDPLAFVRGCTRAPALIDLDPLDPASQSLR